MKYCLIFIFVLLVNFAQASTFTLLPNTINRQELFTQYLFDRSANLMASVRRTEDGSNNNLMHPFWCQTNRNLKRI